MIKFTEWRTRESQEATKGIPAFRKHSFEEKYFKDGMEVLSGFAFGYLSKKKYRTKLAGRKDVQGEKDIDTRDYMYPIG